MLPITTENGKTIFAVLGENVRACEFLHFSGGKYCALNHLGTGKKIFKQASYCFETEKEALYLLRDKLEAALSKVEYQLDKDKLRSL